jgi:formylglycine-generating enzyme required for sulfatase activity
MDDVDADTATHLHELATILRRRQRILEVQRAAYDPRDVPSNRVLELEDVTRQLTRVHADLRRLGIAPAVDRNPYKGLLTFTETDSPFFFGRDALIGQMLTNIPHTAFLAVLGASGSGKSSVVRAGLIPALKQEAIPGSAAWHYPPVIRPSGRPLDMLANALAALQDGTLGTAAALRQSLNCTDHALLLAVDNVNRNREPGRLVLVIDQAEELWTALPVADPERADAVAEQRTFLQLLMAAIAASDRTILVILTLRADFLHRAIEDAALARLLSIHSVMVPPLERDQLRDVVVRPAEIVGGDFEAGLVDALVDQTYGQPGALPLLEYSLEQLWAARQPDGMMQWEALHNLGGITGGVAAKADRLLDEQYSPEQRDSLRTILLKLVMPGEGTADTRRRAQLEDLVPAGQTVESIQALLKPLADARLLTTGHDEEGTVETVEIAHETLIRAWPTLGRWIAQARDDLRFYIQVQEAARGWAANAESDDFLWRGLHLAIAVAWQERAQPSLTDREERFLRISHTQEQARLAEQEAARQRDLDQARASAEAQRLLADQALASAETQRLLTETERQRAQVQRRSVIRQRWIIGLLTCLALIPLSFFLYQIVLKWQAAGAMTEIPGGQATIGEDTEDESGPTWPAPVKSFQMEIHEVSKHQYGLCIQAGSCSPPVDAQFFNEQPDDTPVVNITAPQAATYCSWLGRRLPTEIEWEWAARGPARRPWPWGTTEPSSNTLQLNVAWNGLITVTLQPVTAFPEGRTPETHLLNLAGNALEWTTTRSTAYPYNPDDPAITWDIDRGLAEDMLIVRGGSYITTVDDARPYVRRQFAPLSFQRDIGFRCVR